jgi:phage terminase large subunit-like protein
MADAYPHWIFDGSPIPDPHGRADRAVKFLHSLKHPKSPEPKRQFLLPDFWERIVRRIYGPSNPAGNRQVRTVFIQIPRGARKTTIGAALGLLHTFGYERTPGGLAIMAAGAEDQAALAFDEASGFIEATGGRLQLAARVVGSELELEHPRSGSILRAIPAEGDLHHGKSPTFALVDELHIWKNRRLWRALKTGLLKLPGTLLVIITTAGRGQEGLDWEEYAYARKVATGEVDNPGYLPVIFEPPPKYNWRDEKVWHRVNPGLKQGFPDLEGMRQAALEAVDKPADRDDFRQFNLNERLAKSHSPFVDMDVYDQGSGPIDLTELEGEPCWLGVDLSSNHDLTCIVAAWRDPEREDGYIVHPLFFCPEANLARKAEKDGAPYPLWAEQGFITPTAGNVVDFRAVEDAIRELCDRFDVQEIAFDPHLARVMLNNLLEDGFPAVEFRQGWVSMAPAIKELERAIIAGRFRHGGHPVLRWNFDNVAIETDKAGNKSFHKGKSKDRIDGAVAAAMAVARAAAGDTHRSVYDDPDARPDGLIIF